MSNRYAQREKIRREMKNLGAQKRLIKQINRERQKNDSQYREQCKELEKATDYYNGISELLKRLPENSVAEESLLKAQLYIKSAAYSIERAATEYQKSAKMYEEAAVREHLYERALKERLKCLNSIEKTIILMKYVDGMKHYQIAMKLHYSTQFIDITEMKAIEKIINGQK